MNMVAGWDRYQMRHVEISMKLLTRKVACVTHHNEHDSICSMTCILGSASGMCEFSTLSYILFLCYLILDLTLKRGLIWPLSLWCDASKMSSLTRVPVKNSCMLN